MTLTQTERQKRTEAQIRALKVSVDKFVKALADQQARIKTLEERPAQATREPLRPSIYNGLGLAGKPHQ